MSVPTERYRDQIDADEAGYKWLNDRAELYQCDRIESAVHNREGGLTVTAWEGNRPTVMFTVIRDPFNYSILIKYTF